MNTYLISCPTNNESIIVDPGAEPDVIMDMVNNTTVKGIFITHGHADHIGALKVIKMVTNAPVYIHPLDAKQFKIPYDHALLNNEGIKLGNQKLEAIHTPGHTPGMMSLKLDDSRIIVGDTIFVGGPGRTNSPTDFKTTMKTMIEVVFTWPDNTVFFPGHGGFGTIGSERKSFENFVKDGWSSQLCGDVTWE
jgi:glyoxylase-like metal-dependent hydrolase (beta-lactamase superfamily II)